MMLQVRRDSTRLVVTSVGNVRQNMNLELLVDLRLWTKIEFVKLVSTLCLSCTLKNSSAKTTREVKFNWFLEASWAVTISKL